MIVAAVPAPAKESALAEIPPVKNQGTIGTSAPPRHQQGRHGRSDGRTAIARVQAISQKTQDGRRTGDIVDERRADRACVGGADAALDEFPLQYLRPRLGIEPIDAAELHCQAVPALCPRLPAIYWLTASEHAPRPDSRDPRAARSQTAAGTRDAEHERQRGYQTVIDSDHRGLKGVDLRLRSAPISPAMLRLTVHLSHS